MKVELADQSEIDAIWPLVAERVAKCALEQDTDCNPADLYVRCRGGAAFLIAAWENGRIIGFSISAFEKWTRGTVLNILMMAGTDMSRWRGEMERLGTELAKFGGANRIAWRGRKGWERSQPKARVAAVLMTMEI